MSSPMQTTFLGIVRYGMRSWTDGAYGLRHAFLGLLEEWDLISDGMDCPVTFSEEEIDLHCDVLEKGESRAQRRIILCDEIGCNPDGGIKPEAYDEVKKKAEARRKKWSTEELGPWPLQDGAWTSLLSSLVEMNDFHLDDWCIECEYGQLIRRRRLCGLNVELGFLFNDLHPRQLHKLRRRK